MRNRKRKTFQKKTHKVAFSENFVTFAVAKPRWRNGRRARFRCECREACRFESYSGHKKRSFLSRKLLFFRFFSEKSCEKENNDTIK